MAARTAQSMTARFASTCRTCSGRITPGTAIIWSRAAGAKHASCHNAASGAGEYVFTPCWAGGRCEDAPCCGCGQP